MPLCAWGRQKRRDDEDDGHFEQGVARHASREPPPWVVHAFSFRLNLPAIARERNTVSQTV